MLFKYLFSISLFVLLSGIIQASEVSKDHETRLKSKFSKQHKNLTPIVAVADMFFACNQQRKTDEGDYSVEVLVTKMDRNELADKLRTCLNGEELSSDTALNFGLLGCFHEQLKNLPAEDRAMKKKLVIQAIAKLSKEERQKSFTHCVTDQAIAYLK